MTEPSLLGRFADLRVIHRAPMAELCTGYDVPPDARAAVQKILNDVRAQTP